MLGLSQYCYENKNIVKIKYDGCNGSFNITINTRGTVSREHFFFL